MPSLPGSAQFLQFALEHIQFWPSLETTDPATKFPQFAIAYAVAHGLPPSLGQIAAPLLVGQAGPSVTQVFAGSHPHGAAKFPL